MLQSTGSQKLHEREKSMQICFMESCLAVGMSPVRKVRGDPTGMDVLLPGVRRQRCPLCADRHFSTSDRVTLIKRGDATRLRKWSMHVMHVPIAKAVSMQHWVHRKRKV